MATVTYPPKSFYWLSSNVSFWHFSTLPVIICPSSSKQAEHTICHSALCLYLPSQLWTLYVRNESSVEDCGWWTGSVYQIQGVSASTHQCVNPPRVHRGEIQSVYLYFKACALWQRHHFEPCTGNPTITTLTHCFQLPHLLREQVTKLVEKENLSYKFTKTQLLILSHANTDEIPASLSSRKSATLTNLHKQGR